MFFLILLFNIKLLNLEFCDSIRFFFFVCWAISGQNLVKVLEKE